MLRKCGLLFLIKKKKKKEKQEREDKIYFEIYFIYFEFKTNLKFKG